MEKLRQRGRKEKQESHEQGDRETWGRVTERGERGVEGRGRDTKETARMHRVGAGSGDGTPVSWAEWTASVALLTSPLAPL